ncbi:MAG: FeoA family protein [Candidatus Nanopelagicales bacterium]
MTLDQAPTGVPLTVVAAAPTSAAVTRRLAELGIRIGVVLTVASRTSGGGAIVAIVDDRLAVSRSILTGIHVDRAPANV